MPRDADTPLPVSEPALALWLVEQAAGRGALLHVSAGETQLARVRAEAFSGTGVDVLTMPPRDVLPYCFVRVAHPRALSRQTRRRASAISSCICSTESPA